MLVTITPRWWTFVVRGVLAILFGVAAVVIPQITITALVVLFGAYVLLDGIFALVSAVGAIEHRRRWWPFLVEAMFGLATGIVTFIWPSIHNTDLALRGRLLGVDYGGLGVGCGGAAL